MLGLGRYSQHRKLNSEPEQDDLYGDGESNDDCIYTVLYLGSEDIKGYEENDYPNAVKRIYGRNFSPLNAMVQSKKLSLSVCETGILVTTFPVNSKVFLNFSIPDIVYISSDNNHKKVLAIVSRGIGHNIMLNVFICENEDVPLVIMEQCVKRIDKNHGRRRLQHIQKSTVPAAIAFKYEEENQDIFYDKNVYHKPNALSGQMLQSPESRKDFDSEDEFMQLALKRNVSLPDHLQDKTPESAFLIQDEKNRQMNNQSSMQPDKSNKSSFFKTSFFSSYSRVSSGQP